MTKTMLAWILAYAWAGGSMYLARSRDDWRAGIGIVCLIIGLVFTLVFLLIVIATVMRG